MKTTTKSRLLFSGITIFLIGLLFISCSRDLNNDETVSQDKSSLSEGNSSQFAKGSEEDIKIDTVFVVDETRKAMISFTKEIKEYYEEGMTYSQLKSALDPENNLDNNTVEGDALLSEAYSNITNDVSEKDVNGQKITEALQFILQNSKDQGYTNTKEVDFESGSKVLFGLDATYETTAKEGGCKWYQIGCHVSSVWHWLSADANGDQPGTTTNGQVLGAALSAVASVISIWASIF